MSKTVVMVGSLDTKGEEFLFVKSLIESQGMDTLVVDFGVMGKPGFTPDISSKSVAKASGGDLTAMASGSQKDQAMKSMAAGLASVVADLYRKGQLDGIIGMGGTGGTSIATTAMRTLPVGVPKLMVSTVGGGDVTAYAGAKDITFMPSIVDVAGLNSISRAIFANAAGTICGMVRLKVPDVPDKKPLVAASMFGNTTKAVDHAREIVKRNGYDVLIFHATGSGGKTMEGLIADGYFVGSLDITTTELADYVCGGVFDAGPDRCMASSLAGIPTLFVPGCVDMANFGARDSVPKKYQNRNLYEWNPNVTLLRTNAEENQRIGEMIAAAANASHAPTEIVLPLKGVSMLDEEGGQFWDEEADQACFEAIRRKVKRHIKVVEIDRNINDPQFSGDIAARFLNLLQE